MKAKQALIWGANELRDFDNPRLEVEVLLMHALGWDRMALYLNLDNEVSMGQYQELVKRRKAHAPSAYLTGQREFCGFEFEVNPAVLIPRPSTESLVYRAVELIKQCGDKTIYDIGTGSGNIAISIAKLIPEAKVIASDIDEPSLNLAQHNAVSLGVDDRVRFLKSNLADHIDHAELIVANLPYVPHSFEVTPEVAQEPRPAIFDEADDGLGFYRRLFQNPVFNQRVRYVLIELRPEQYPTMAGWLVQRYPKVKTQPIRNIDQEIWGLEADFRVL